jgi:GLPGLI family protein
MKGFLLINVFSLILYNLVSAQNTDSALLKVFYEFNFATDSLSPSNKKKDVLVLEIGKYSSKCYSYKKFQTDSAMISDLERSKALGNISIDARKYDMGGMSQQFYKNYSKNTITVTDRILRTTYLYIDSLNLFQWQIMTDTTTILNYSCQKATCTFRGRNYIAWFTPQIPLNEGPLKFGELPGLILRLKDSKDNFEFNCISLENLRKKEPIDFSVQKSLKITRQKYMDVIKIMNDDPVGFAQSQGAPIFMVNGQPPHIPKRTFNPIELE